MEEQRILCFIDRCLYYIKRISMVKVFVSPSVSQICFAKAILFFNLPLSCHIPTCSHSRTLINCAPAGISCIINIPYFSNVSATNSSRTLKVLTVLSAKAQKRSPATKLNSGAGGCYFHRCQIKEGDKIA